MMNHYGKPLTVGIEHGVLVIRIGAQTLAHATAFSEWANPCDIDGDGGYWREFAIEDPVQFTKDVASEMQRESEDGSSPLSNFLDAMSEAAVNDGSLGLAEGDYRIEYCKFAPIESWSSDA